MVGGGGFGFAPKKWRGVSYVGKTYIEYKHNQID